MIPPSRANGEGTRHALPCQVWFADITLERPAHRALLDPAEQNRRAAFRQDADKARFTVAAALLRVVVAREIGIAPPSLRIDRSCKDCGRPHGKPRILDADVHVSVSHSGGKVALALTRTAPVGVDIETASAVDVAALAPLVLAPDEQVDGVSEFLTCWCRKESAVKATGDGLRVPLTQVAVTPPGEPARLISYRGASLVASMRDLPIDPGYAAALTVLAEGDLDLQIYDASSWLSA